MKTPLYRRRQWTDILHRLITILLTIAIFIILLWILSALVVNALPAMHWSIFIKNTAPADMQGGLANTIMGSLLMTGIAIVLTIPLGVAAGIYLAEYNHLDSKLAKLIRFSNNILLSAPSIIIGLFVYEILVVRMQHFSGWAGILALMIIALPIIISTTETMCRLVPVSLREAATALGALPYRIILPIIIKGAKTGILTGVLLAFARISGEVAPLLFTALNNQFWSLNLNQAMPNLPSTIFDYALSPYPKWQSLAWAGALLITLWVLIINIIIKLTHRRSV